MENALVERARGGDVGAYEELVRRYQDIAVRTAYVVTGDGAEAEDIAQDAFVKAFYALNGFQSGAPFRPWLLRIVVNEARNRRKAGARRAALVLRAAEEGSAVTDPSPEDTALAAERRATLLRALNEMSDEDHQVIAYRYFLDLSEAEMAAALGCARGTVKSRLARALGRLRRGLGAADDAATPEEGGRRKGDAYG